MRAMVEMTWVKVARAFAEVGGAADAADAGCTMKRTMLEMATEDDENDSESKKEHHLLRDLEMCLHCWVLHAIFCESVHQC